MSTDSWCECWPIVINSSVGSSIQIMHGCIVLIDGRLCVNGKESTARSMAEVIAGAVDYDQESAEQVFKQALNGEPVDASFGYR